MTTSTYMWPTLRERDGYAQAIRKRYPQWLNDPVIALAVAQIEMAQLAIDAKVQEFEAVESEP